VQVLSIEVDSNVAVALSNLSTFYETNTPARRHALRDDIESRCVGAHWELIEKYSEIQKVFLIGLTVIECKCAL
jgi:hypothetical protein